MPVHIQLANLVFSKAIIEKKYTGGIRQFRLDFNIGTSEVNQEDDELFLVAQMNLDEFDIRELVNKGLSFDPSKTYSYDFVAVTRYGGYLWSVDWLEGNTTFAWHTQCAEWQKEKAIYLSEEITMDVVAEQWEKGIDVFETIKTRPLASPDKNQ
jgi:hypothetical protein